MENTTAYASTDSHEEYHPLWLVGMVVLSAISTLAAMAAKAQSSAGYKYSYRARLGLEEMLPLRHPFTAIVAGPTSCGKTRFVFRLRDHVSRMIDPPPSKIVYCYGEYQQLFCQYPRVIFHQGLPELNDFDAGNE